MADETESLLLKFLSGTATPEEEKTLIQWRQHSEANQKIFDDYQKIYNVRMSANIPSFNTETEWQKLENKISKSDVAVPKVFRMTFWLKVAAAVFALVATIFVLQQMTREKSIVHATGNELATIKLHDGTTVFLNVNSSITHSTDFNRGERLVTLTGEAFFEVHPDKQRPFIVIAGESQIKVLGTSFNVRARPGSPEQQVEVLEGLVSFGVKDHATDMVKLKAGSKGILNKESKQVITKVISPDNILAWKTKKLVFKGTSLDEVLDVVEGYFGIEFLVNNSDLLHCRFTSTFVDPNLEEVLDALSVSLNLDIIKKNTFYSIEGEGCK
jgi:transmembrane sensor